MHLLNIMKSNKICKGLVLCSSFLFPILCIIYLGADTRLIAFHYVWVAFYSSLLFCLLFRSKAAKLVICILNGICVIGLTLIFLMGGFEIVPGVIWNAVVPFLPNPWY